jgi:hypothetical protein
MRLFGGELPKLDSSSQDENLKSGLDVQVDSAHLMIAVTSGGIIQSTAISEDDGIAFQGFTISSLHQTKRKIICFPPFLSDF